MHRFIFGFTSLTDLVTSVFSKSWSLSIPVSTLVTWCAAAAGFIHPDGQVVYGLVFLMFLDWITGVLKALKQNKFNSFTFQRFFFNLVARCCLIAAGHHMASWYSVFEVLHLADVLAVGFILTEFISITENLAALDSRIVPLKMQKYLAQITDLDTVAARFWPSNSLTPNPIPADATPLQVEPAVAAALVEPAAAEPELMPHE